MSRTVEIVCCEQGTGLPRVLLLLHLLEEHRGDIPPEIYDPVKAAVDECVAAVSAIIAEEGLEEL